MSREQLEKQIADIDSVILTLKDLPDNLTDPLLMKQYYLKKELEELEVDRSTFREQNKTIFDSIKQTVPIDLESKNYDQLRLIKKAMKHKDKLTEEQFKVLIENL